MNGTENNDKTKKQKTMFSRDRFIFFGEYFGECNRSLSFYNRDPLGHFIRNMGLQPHQVTRVISRAIPWVL